MTTQREHDFRCAKRALHALDYVEFISYPLAVHHRTLQMPSELGEVSCAIVGQKMYATPTVLSDSWMRSRMHASLQLNFVCNAQAVCRLQVT